MPVRAWDPTPYPDPRERKAVTTATGELIDVARPRARRFAFHVLHNVERQPRTVVSPRFLGPGFIRSVNYNATYSQSAANPTLLDLRIAADGSGQGLGVANGPLPAGRGLYDLAFSSVQTYTPALLETFTQDTNMVQRDGAGPHVLNEYVDMSEWWLKATVVPGSAVLCGWVGVVTLYEGVDPELAIELLA